MSTHTQATGSTVRTAIVVEVPYSSQRSASSPRTSTG